MKDLINSFQGKKTYVLMTIAVIGMFGTWQHWWVMPNEVYAALLALMMGTLRHGISTEGDSATAILAQPRGDGVAPGAPGAAGKSILGVCVIGALGLSLLSGCLLSKTVTPGTGGAPATTNSVVNTNNLTLECGIVTEAAAAASAYFSAHPSDLPILQDIRTALDGILNGSNPQTVSQAMDLIGASGSPSAVQALTPFVNQVSAVEQLLLQHYSGKNGVIITTYFARAVLDGLNRGLPTPSPKL